MTTYDYTPDDSYRQPGTLYDLTYDYVAAVAAANKSRRETGLTVDQVLGYHAAIVAQGPTALTEYVHDELAPCSARSYVGRWLGLYAACRGQPYEVGS